MLLIIATVAVLGVLLLFIWDTSRDQESNSKIFSYYTPFYAESIVTHEYLSTPESVWKSLTDLGSYQSWFPNIKRLLPDSKTDRYVHQFSFNEFSLLPGAGLLLRPNSWSPFYKSRVVVVNKNKEISFDFKISPLYREYINFSLKADSKTIHGGSVYDGMEVVYEMFSGVIAETDRKQGLDFMDDVRNQPSDIARKDAIDGLWKLLGSVIPVQPDFKWNDYFWDVLEKRLFGSSDSYNGKIQLLEMNRQELSEISQNGFKRLRNSGIELFPQYRKSKPTAAAPGDIRIMPKYANGIVETDTAKAIFVMRPSYLHTGPKDASGKRQGKAYPKKIMIELGKKFSVVHDENWDEFFRKELVE